MGRERRVSSEEEAGGSERDGEVEEGEVGRWRWADECDGEGELEGRRKRETRVRTRSREHT
jgi:hypothetical protein